MLHPSFAMVNVEQVGINTNLLVVGNNYIVLN
jgi:hypothetical protein